MELSNSQKLDYLYETVFNREADDAGKYHHLSLLESGVDFREIAKAFVMSSEFSNKYTGVTDPVSVLQVLMWNGLERHAGLANDEIGLWGDYLKFNTTGDAAALIATSVEIVGSAVTYDPF